MDTIEKIESQCNELARQIASVGEFCPGNLCTHNRKCGNPKCQCARLGGTLHHGWALTRKVRRKTRCRSIPEFALDDTRRQVDEYKHFLDLVSRFTEINEMLCDRRLKLRRNEKNRCRAGGGIRSRCTRRRNAERDQLAAWCARFLRSGGL